MRLLKLSNDEFIVVKNETAKFFSSKEKLLKSSVIPKVELQVALVVLESEKDNYAEFGDVNNSFIYTGKL